MAGDNTPFSDTNRARFLELLTEGSTITDACNALSLSRSRAYQLRRENKDFADLWDEAVQIGTDLLEDEAFRRAYHGVERLKFDKHGGAAIDPRTGNVYIEREYSDGLLTFLLRARRPDKYRENVKVEQTGDGGGPVKVQIEYITPEPIPTDD